MMRDILFYMKRCVKASDIELVESCLKKDMAAWADFVKRYSPLIRISIDNRLKKYGFNLPCEEIEDIRQGVLSSIWKDNKLEHVKNRDDISYWLSIVSGNMAVEHMRIKHRREPVKQVSLSEKIEDGELSDLIPSGTKGPQDEAAKNELSSKIEEAFEMLPAKERLIAKLAIIHEKKYDEIAEILHLPQGTVSSYLKRAKEKMQKELKDFL